MNPMLQHREIGNGAIRTSISGYNWMPLNASVCLNEHVACSSRFPSCEKFRMGKLWHRNGVFEKLMESFHYQRYMNNIVINLSFCLRCAHQTWLCNPSDFVSHSHLFFRSPSFLFAVVILFSPQSQSQWVNPFIGATESF